MNAKQIARVVIDLAMVAVLPLLMAYSLVGETSHEWLGIAIFVLFVIHNLLNISWYKNLLHGKYTAFRIALVIINSLLLADFLLLIYSGIDLSKHLFSFLPSLSRASVSRALHLACSHWGMVLMSVHLGIHINRFTRLLNKHKSAYTMLCVLVYLISACGLCLFFADSYPSYMFPTSNFLFFDTGRPLGPHLAQSASIMTLFAMIGNTVAKLARKTIKK